MIRRILVFLFAVCSTMVMAGTEAVSPNGRLSLRVNGEGYVLSYRQLPVLQIAAVGMELQGCEGARVQRCETLALGKRVAKVKADYQMLSGKCLHCTNQANEYRVRLDANTVLVVRLYNDGLAFRYELTDSKGGCRRN